MAPTNLQHYPTLPPSYILKHKNLKSRQLFKKVGCFVFFRAFHPVPWPLKGTVVPTPTPIIPKRGAGSLTVDLLQFAQEKNLAHKKNGMPGYQGKKETNLNFLFMLLVTVPGEISLSKSVINPNCTGWKQVEIKGGVVKGL